MPEVLALAQAGWTPSRLSHRLSAWESSNLAQRQPYAAASACRVDVADGMYGLGLGRGTRLRGTTAWAPWGPRHFGELRSSFEVLPSCPGKSGTG